MTEPGAPETPDTSHGENAYLRLLDAIRRGELAPGARLRETELSLRLGISRTPVREALRRLEAEGLVTHAPRLGAVVRSLQYQEIMELYEMRAVLEGTAARMAARHASDIETAELDALNSAMATADDPAEVARANARFHAGILHAAKNRFLIRAMEALEKTLLILGPSTLADAERARAAAEEHRKILVAIRQNDGAKAEARMRAHIEAGQRARLILLRERFGLQ